MLMQQLLSYDLIDSRPLYYQLNGPPKMAPSEVPTYLLGTCPARKMFKLAKKIGVSTSGTEGTHGFADLAPSAMLAVYAAVLDKLIAIDKGGLKHGFTWHLV